ncbi:hypothetical protein IU500_21940 [Nocardia terpenica]|uniref:hypothetical protein n=1 Tax=Nocardia terpenica TaxID=455432 RepID=UPI0002F1C274|nr:hypothetical protein [Nocardia terpenica]MBF6064368.1 hypothetical protein [Nocardia terpenica]MBF6106701.1 hypothetical protein [Nocardia terpenica]MBF6113986.1 hypothetical protein [Nocardia terpenica]MBF6120390.1 hypothetical protein [Nocardia terpenica]MBF6157184.1 hypothetical protein [Nocardia terpenica]
MTRRVRGECVWSVAIPEYRQPARRRFVSYCPPGWLLLELPTSLLLAVFVGTGWLGYAQHARPVHAGAIPAVVAPAVPPAGEVFGRR